MKNLKDKFDVVARAGQRVVHEMPIKVYSSIFAVGDLSFLAGGIVAKNPVWIASAATFMSMNVMKVCFGTGGMWDENLPKPTLSSVGSFLKDVGSNTMQLISCDYWGSLREAAQNIEWDKVKNRALNAWKVKENPFDAGLLGYIAGGVGLLIDGANLFSYRADMSLTTMMTGGMAVAGAGITFVTDRNDLAGPAFSASSLCVGAIALADPNGSGALGALCALPLYLVGDYFISRVKTEHQSLTHGQ